MKYVGDRLKEISFPLGGIGTGCIGLNGSGRLVDWEIFNRPSKGSVNGRSHFAVRALRGDKIVAKILNGDVLKDFSGQYKKVDFMHTGFGFGPEANTMCGFPHFKNVEFIGEFPVAELTFSDDGFPAKVKTTAFNPFIPRDAFNSSIPAAFFELEIENTTDEDIVYQAAFSVANPFDVSRNVSGKKLGYKTITLYNDGVSTDDCAYGDLTVATDCVDASSQAYWYRGAWQDAVVTFWNEFTGERQLRERDYDAAGKRDVCTLVAEISLAPKAKGKVRFVLSWNIPNNRNDWSYHWSDKVDEKIRRPWKNYYATVFENSIASAEYALKHWSDLYARTLKFKNALHGSTLPEDVIDAASANLAVLKSPTVWRLQDGSFYGWEGSLETKGSCEGTCQHVWNYAYALCFLFPELERSIRDNEFKYCTDGDGRMAFRMQLPVGRGVDGFRACLDGQAGAVIKCYREWKISGDNEWLKANWENIKKVLEYAWSDKNPDRWDADKDGVLEGRQHHTLDMELFGASSWLEGMYLLALKAATEMAVFLGDEVKSREYGELFAKGYEWTRNNLFNGKYFIQKVDLKDKAIIDAFGADDYWNDESKQIKYQIGEGSSIDQLLAQWHSDILGLGDVFDKRQISVALSEMMKNNFKPSMREIVNPWRLFSVNDEAGTQICVYPDGAEKPYIPVPYCEETMTGFEYSFAGLLFGEGKISDGLKVVKAVRDRFDGAKRNPWNEFECGSNYARSMASFALVPLLCGFEFDMPRGRIGFNPYKKDGFKCVWSLADAWGTFEVSEKSVRLKIEEGKIKLRTVGLRFLGGCSAVVVDGKSIEYVFKDGSVNFLETEITDGVEIFI